MVELGLGSFWLRFDRVCLLKTWLCLGELEARIGLHLCNWLVCSTAANWNRNRIRNRNRNRNRTWLSRGRQVNAANKKRNRDSQLAVRSSQIRFDVPSSALQVRRSTLESKIKMIAQIERESECEHERESASSSLAGDCARRVRSGGQRIWSQFGGARAQ